MVQNLIAEAEVEIVELGKRVRDLEGFIRVLRSRQEPEEQPESEETSLGNMTLPKAIQEVLQGKGPMHVKEIVEALIDLGIKPSKHLASAVSSTCRRKEDTFRQAGPNTFELVS